MAASAGLRHQTQVVSGGAAGGGKQPPGDEKPPWKQTPTDKVDVPATATKQVPILSFLFCLSLFLHAFKMTG
jgi:hypothetical protein